MFIVCTEGERIASTDPRRIRKLQALLNLVCFVVIAIVFVKYFFYYCVCRSQIPASTMATQ